MKIINLHIYLSNFTNESRIFKETTSISKLELADKIIMIGLMTDNLPEFQKLDEVREIHRVRLFISRFKKSKLTDVFKLIEFSLRVVLKYKKLKPTFVNLHSLAVLPLSFFFKNKGNKVIYDPHELETERIGMKGLSRRFLKFTEVILIKFVDATIVVSDPIKDWYVNQYGLKRIIVVRNMHHAIKLGEQKSLLLKNKFEITHEQILFIYQGLLVRGRGINLLLKVFSSCNSNKHIVFMGYGDEENNILSYVSKCKNIHFQPAVNYEHIVEYTSSADIGIHILEEDKGLSYRYSLPNKFGEYLISGIPIMVSNHYEYMSKLIHENSIGWSIDSGFENLVSIVNDITFQDLNDLKKSVEIYKSQIGWEVDEKLYECIYK